MNCRLRLKSRERIKPIRGNVQTRLNKLAAGEHDEIILARAGLERLFFYFRKGFLKPPGQNKDFAGEPGFSGDSFDYGRFCYIPLSLEQMLPRSGTRDFEAVEPERGNDGYT